MEKEDPEKDFWLYKQKWRVGIRSNRDLYDLFNSHIINMMESSNLGYWDMW